ncbi:MAG: glycosyltransferase [Acidithiobacillus sp.]
MASFEPFGDPERKNIAATIAAFLQGVGHLDNVWLIIKTNNANNDFSINVLRSIESLTKNHPRIRFVNKNFSYEDVLAFYRLCDVYVSLHRAEGFGLGLFEAMALEKPVIATSWSGNMSFMDAESACLVPYDLIPLQNSNLAVYFAKFVGTEARWAEPNINRAAEWMMVLASNAELRQQIGSAARRRIVRWNEDAYRSRFWDSLQSAKKQKILFTNLSGKNVSPIVVPSPWLANWRFLPMESVWMGEAAHVWSANIDATTMIFMVFKNFREAATQATQENLAQQWLPVRTEVIAAGHDPVASINTALAEMDAGWLAVLDAGDELAPDATFRIAQAIHKHPEWQIIYTDEDPLTADGTHVNPHCKPDFNLDYLRSLPYVGGLMLIKKTLFDALGGFDPQAEGAEDYDFVLRAWEHVGDAGIGHIPEVLYHRRQGSSHCNKSVPEILEAGKQALQRHLQRLDIAAEVLSGPFPPSFRVRYPLSTTPLVSMVVPTRNQLGFLQRCIESVIEKTRYPNYEILIVDNNSDDPETCTYLDLLTAQEESMGGRLRVLRYPGAFNFSAMNNRAVDVARGDHILLLNNDTAVLHEDWLDEMVSHILRPEVGVVGAKLFYPDGKIQHAGVILGMRGPAEHPFIGHPPEDRGYFGRAMLTQNYSAVTGACLLISKSLYQEVGGLDEKHFKVSYNDVDLCLKVREAGHKIVWTPWAMLLHEGSASQKGDVEKQADKNKLARFAAEKAAFYDRWLPQLAFDPAYNRHLSLASTDFLLEDQAALTWDPEWRPRPRILVHPADREGCGEYRIISPMRALNAAGKVQGWETMRIFEPAEMTRFSPESMVLQRQMEWPQIEALERHKRFSSAFRVFEIDDLITNLPVKSVHKGQIHKDIAKRFRKAASLCDRLVVATEPLAQAYKGYSDEVRVQPNYVERAVWGDLLPNRRGGVKPRVGWAGGVGHTGDLELVADVVRDLAQEVDWVFFGLCPEALRPYVHEFYAGVPLSQYPAQLASLDLDLAIAPLEINAFNDAKSHLRILEYGVLGFPVVCSDITPYQGDFPVWRVANRYRDWMKTIREAVSDRTALAMAGDALRAHVQSHWMLEDHLDDWLKVWLP